MFLGGMGGPGSPEPGMDDAPKTEEQRLKEMQSTLNEVAAKQSAPPQPGQADYPTQEAADSGGPADPNKDFWFLNRTEGEEYGSSDPTGSQKKEGIEAQIRTAEATEKTQEAIEHVREDIAQIKDSKGEHAEADKGFLENLQDAA